MKKILVIGCGGSGKSTLSIALHQKLNIPVIHLDQAYWNPNWQETEQKKWEGIIKELIQQPAWVMDGNYGGTLDIRLAAADTVIFLQYPTWLCLWRVLKRTFQHYGTTRPTMVEGCKERWSWQFYHYILMYNMTRTPNLLKKLNALPDTMKVYILKGDREKETFLGLI